MRVITEFVNPCHRAWPTAQGNPTLKTTLAVMRALGIELTAKTAA
jgi:DNA-binding phage protein